MLFLLNLSISLQKLQTFISVIISLKLSFSSNLQGITNSCITFLRRFGTRDSGLVLGSSCGVVDSSIEPKGNNLNCSDFQSIHSVMFDVPAAEQQNLHNFLFDLLLREVSSVEHDGTSLTSVILTDEAIRSRFSAEELSHLERSGLEDSLSDISLIQDVSLPLIARKLKMQI